MLLNCKAAVTHLNQRSEDGDWLGCTLGSRIKETLHLREYKENKEKENKYFLRESSVNPNNLPSPEPT